MKINTITKESNEKLLSTILGIPEDIIRIYSLRHVIESPLAINGIGPKKAEKLFALSELLKRLVKEPEKDEYTIRSPHDVFELLQNLRFESTERFLIICLDTKNHVLAMPTISIGSLDASIVHPREVFKEAMKYPVSSIILAHNHPSGDPTPSREDIHITRRLIKSGEILDIEVLDHIIIGDNRYTSIKEEDLL